MLGGEGTCNIIDFIIKDCIFYRQLCDGQALEIFEAMWNYAKSLGVLPLKDELEGIEKNIILARILNSCSRNCFFEVFRDFTGEL